MNKYIGKIERYFGGHGTFEIEAPNKEEAKREILKKANIYDNYILSTLKIKKFRNLRTDETKICFGLAIKQNNAKAKAVRRINT
ncbi:hypothetical protein [uncultured Eubacterium sp.]|uniref:hypothetical protein n=1 Tax=uncultured Eubacterium sp. TaxID=165185 RepID=UPI002619DD6D|nr:hypothetical protein [uncultured Eubacterium sp.]